MNVGASPSWLGPAEGKESLTAETVWQQPLLVQINFRIGTTDLTAHTKTKKLYSAVKTKGGGKSHLKRQKFPFGTLHLNRLQQIGRKSRHYDLDTHKHTDSSNTFTLPPAHTNINDI